MGVKINRVKTYVEGFDGLVSGGVPRRSCVVVNGDPGSGKTIFSLEYLVNGALKEKEVGVYFTFEEKKEALILQASQFGWDLEKLEKKGLLKIISIGTDLVDKTTVSEMVEIVKSLKAKRVVVDSVSTLAFLVESDRGVNEIDSTRFLYDFVASFKDIDDLTSVFISQKDSIGARALQFICDGIVLLLVESLGGNYARNMCVKKMRSTKINEDLHHFEIVDGVGVRIKEF